MGGVLRTFINSILSVIGASSLTDPEFDTFTITAQEYSAALYLEILAVLDSRELVSNTRERLTWYFKARGVDVEPTSKARSNILAGVVL